MIDQALIWVPKSTTSPSHKASVTAPHRITVPSQYVILQKAKHDGTSSSPSPGSRASTSVSNVRKVQLLGPQRRHDPRAVLAGFETVAPCLAYLRHTMVLAVSPSRVSCHLLALSSMNCVDCGRGGNAPGRQGTVQIRPILLGKERRHDPSEERTITVRLPCSVGARDSCVWSKARSPVQWYQLALAIPSVRCRCAFLGDHGGRRVYAWSGACSSCFPAPTEVYVVHYLQTSRQMA